MDVLTNEESHLVRFREPDVDERMTDVEESIDSDGAVREAMRPIANKKQTTPRSIAMAPSVSSDSEDSTTAATPNAAQSRAVVRSYWPGGATPR